MKIKKLVFSLLMVCAIGSSSAVINVNAESPENTKINDDVLLGDVNLDKIIDARDASMTLIYYAMSSADKETDLKPEQIMAADFNSDNKVDSRDASAILTYYATESASSNTGEPVVDPPRYKNISIGNKTDDNSSGGIKSKYMYWVDINENKNYIFNGRFLKVTFKLSEDIPCGDYTVKFRTDFSIYAGATVRPDVIYNGCLRVGTGDMSITFLDEDGFIVYGDNVVCSQGDTVDYYISIENNPGIAAALIWIDYDENLMTIENIAPVGEFEKIVTQ